MSLGFDWLDAMVADAVKRGDAVLSIPCHPLTQEGVFAIYNHLDKTEVMYSYDAKTNRIKVLIRETADAHAADSP